MSAERSRLLVALFSTWLLGYFAHWLASYDQARPMVGIGSIALVMWVYAGVVSRPKDPPTS